MHKAIYYGDVCNGKNRQKLEISHMSINREDYLNKLRHSHTPEYHMKKEQRLFLLTVTDWSPGYTTSKKKQNGEKHMFSFT